MTRAVSTNSVDLFLQKLVPGYPVNLYADDNFGNLIPTSKVQAAFVEEERKRIINPIFEYLFHRISSKEMISKIGAWDNYPQSEDFRVQLSGAGFLAKNLKIFVYYWIREGKKMMHWLDHPADAGVCEWLSPDLVEWIASDCQHDAVPYVALTLERFDFLLAHVIEATSKLPTEHVPHQYRWVIQSQPVEAADIVRALQERGIQALYKTYPRVCSTDHAICIVGRAMKNFGMNLFHYFSSDQRQALVKVEDHGMVSAKMVKELGKVKKTIEAPPVTIIHADGMRVEIEGEKVLDWRVSKIMHVVACREDETEEQFRARCLEDASKIKVEGDNSFDSFGARMDPSAMDYLASQDNRLEQLQDRMTVDAILRTVTDEQKLELLRLLTGEYDEAFTQHLSSRGVLRPGQSNDEWQERAPVATQVRHAASFLDMKEEHATAFLGELRKQHGVAVH